MDLILLLLKSSRLLLLGTLVASLLGGLGVSVLVALINRSLSLPRSELPRLGLEFALFCIAMLAFRWSSQAQLVALSQRMLAQLRQQISEQFARAPFAEIEQRGPTRLFAALTEDVNSLAEFLMMVPRLVVHGAVVLGCLGYLAYLSWPGFVFVVALALPGVLGHLENGRRANGHLREARRLSDEVMDDFRAIFDGAKELQLNRARREEFVTLLEGNVERVRAERTRGLQIYFAGVSWRVFLSFVAIGGMLFVVGPLLAIDERIRSGYALTLLYMMLPLHLLLEASPEVARMRIAVERLRALGIQTPAASAAPHVEAPGPLLNVSLSDVRHSYHRENDDRAFTLGPLSLELRPGEVVFLVGGNGSGKTTLAKLVVGLYEPEGGVVSLNGSAVGEGGRQLYREHFSAVFSDTHLFDELLGVGSDGLDERALRLLAALELDHKVTVQDGRFSTTSLSRGQQKRLALLVSMLEDRPIYVFDEWAADQEPRFKETFYHEVLSLLRERGKAVLVITHDDRYFHLADRRLHLEAGQLLAAHEVPAPAYQPQWRQ